MRCRAMMAGLAVALTAVLPGAPADAQEAPPAANRISISGDIEAGLTLSPGGRSPLTGPPLTDRANVPLFNQALLTIEKPPDPSPRVVTAGFHLQLLFGSDARYTRLTGQFTGATVDRAAFDVVEAHLRLRLPVARGIDVRIGSYVSPVGYEVLAAPDNIFYSHSYIFSFGVPTKHAGLLTTTHLRGGIDIYAGIDAGVNASIERDDNAAPAFIAGFGYTRDGLSLVALSHIGAELPRGSPGVRPDRDLRYVNDIFLTWQISKRLMLVSELNYVRDDGLRAEAGGFAQYAVYTLGPRLSIAGRAELWRDDKGVFVARFPGVNDAFNAQLGLASGAQLVGAATYLSLTAGISWRPWKRGGAAGVRLRPELRYDRALAGRPFDEGRGQDQWTLAADIVLPFRLR